MSATGAFPLEPSPIFVPDEVLDDLRARLALTRPPLDEGNEDWFYGVPAGYAWVGDLRRTFRGRRP